MRKEKHEVPVSQKKSAAAGKPRQMKGSVILIHLALIILLGFVIYSNATRGDFVLDDYSLLQGNTYIKSFKTLPLLFTNILEPIVSHRYGTYRPVVSVTYLIDYLAWGLKPEGFHLTNIFLHIVTGLSVYWLITLLFGYPALSLWTALFFMALPVHVEAVAYISGRNDILALLFMLLSFISYLKHIRYSRALFAFFAFFFYLLAILSKESALALPLFLGLYHYVFKEKLRPRCFGSIVAAGSFLVLSRTMFFKSALIKVSAAGTALERVPGVFVAFINYLRLLIFPFDLHMDYGQKIFSWNDPAVLSGLFVFIGFLILLFFMRRKGLIFFAMSWFLLAFIPVSNIYPLPFYMAEHWLYVPSIGFCLILAKIASPLYEKKHGSLVLKVLMAGLLVYYGALTIRQNGYWQDAIPFYERTLKFSPRNAAIYTDLGRAYEEKGRIEEAMEAYQDAIRVAPAYVKSYNNLGLIYYSLGREEEAVRIYKTAIEINPNSPLSYNNLAVIYAQRGQTEKALELFNKSISLDPNYASGYLNIGNLYSDLGRYEEAVASYKKALKLYPGYAKVYDQLGITYKSMNRIEDAAAFYKEAIHLDPRSASPHYNLGMIYKEKGENKEALASFKHAMELEPRNIDGINALASLYRTMGRHDKAIDLYEKAIAIDPKNPILYFNQGNVSFGLGRRQEAIALYEKAVEIDPGFAQALDNLAIAYFYDKRYDEAIIYADRAKEKGLVNDELLESLKPYRKGRTAQEP
jgi:tetratricopeptide (TPR) repeat protein